jgi:superfamily II DNA or RNA helicase
MSDPSPFVLDNEQLRILAPEKVVAEGLRWFKENRVMEVDAEGDNLWAVVEDPEEDEPFNTELARDGEGRLSVRCGCDTAQDRLCAHAVAALLQFGASRDPTAASLASAREAALAERRHKGRTEVRVQHLGGEPWFGTWRASSVDADPDFRRSYQVHIRSLQGLHNYCTCPDFAVNQLGTCKHIEAVLHQVGKRRDLKKLRGQSAPFPYVFLDWESEQGPLIRVFRSGLIADDLGQLLDEYFQGDGRFRGLLPDDFFRFAEQVGEREDIDLGVDARDHALRLAEQAAQRERAARIRARIMESGGRLPGIRARLYPYQTEGVAFLAANGRALLADDMGLGKTLQAIGAAAWLREQEAVVRVLVVCPASLKHQWAREIERFCGQPVQVVQGPPPTRLAQYRKADGFTVVNYELIRRDLSVINETLRPDLLILDEAQRIKNWRTKIATAVKRIPSRYAFVLTGTPLENRLEDLYSLMQVVDQRLLGPLWRYLADFHVTDERGKVLGYRNLSELRRRLAPAMLRRDRSLVREQLPERIVQRLDVPMTEKQRELHGDAMSQAGQLAHIAKRRPLTPSEQNRLVSSLQKARMACNAAGLVDKETEGSPKLDELATLLDELCLQGGLKAVVFSEWERMTAMVERLLRRMRLGSVRLHGGVPSARRGELMDRFREDDSVQAFISTDAGGTGLNLQNASVLVNLDMPWNPAVLEQRNARVHRLGQRERVQIVNMVAQDSYEEQVLALVGNKRDLFDNVVDPEATEDVVGVSKRLLETLVEDLAGERREQAESPQTPAAAADQGDAGTVTPGRPRDQEGASPELTECIQALQTGLGPRIERILGSGGRLLVVLDRVDSTAEELAERLSATVPVALVDALTLKGLMRMGDAFGFSAARVHLDAADRPQPEGPSPLLHHAREQLRGAELLIGQQCPRPAVDLLISAMLGAAADLAGQDHAPALREAGLWLHGEILPKGLLAEHQSAALQRALALAQAPHLPDSLVQGLLEDARVLMGG